MLISPNLVLRALCGALLALWASTLGGCISDSLAAGSNPGAVVKSNVDAGRVTSRFQVEQCMGAPTEVFIHQGSTNAAYAFRYVPRNRGGMLGEALVWLPVAIVCCPPSGLASAAKLVFGEPGRIGSELDRHAQQGRTHTLHVQYDQQGMIIPGSCRLVIPPAPGPPHGPSPPAEPPMARPDTAASQGT